MPHESERLRGDAAIRQAEDFGVTFTPLPFWPIRRMSLEEFREQYPDAGELNEGAD